jgi:hypothetical protein
MNRELLIGENLLGQEHIQFVRQFILVFWTDVRTQIKKRNHSIFFY